jgi:maltooligosyltrehalose trehalohydrolase
VTVRGLAVVLDVVYNHLGPEGNYLGDYGPYFTDRYRTPWGAAINFDGPRSDDVRRFFIQNALFWISEYHVDALRLDAVHAILDFSARPFLEELAEAVHEYADHLNRQVHLIAESALNDTRIIRSRDLGGFGLDAQWNDDFHHALHTLLTGEKSGYYQDFGRLQDLVKAYREGFVYSGQHSPYRARRHGNSSSEIQAHRFVVFAQNHDQVGNRMRGERLSQLISLEGLKLAAGAVLLSPFIPLIFMGEEYAESSPFPFFISHSDPDLIEGVRKGRREEFAAFGWPGDPPDPQEEVTFFSAKLNHRLFHQGHHRVLLAYYKELIKLRKEVPALAKLSKEHQAVQGYDEQLVLLVLRWSGLHEAALLLHFGGKPAVISLSLPSGRWHKRIDSAEKRWQGPGSIVPDQIHSEGAVVFNFAPRNFVLLTRDRNN